MVRITKEEREELGLPDATSPQRTKISVAYLLLFSAYGVLLPFLPVFMNSVQMTDSQIGFIFAAQRIVSCVATPAAGWVADSLGQHRVVLILCMSLSAFANLLFLPASTAESLTGRFWAILGVIVFTALLSSSTPVLDSFAMQHMGSATEYGRVRLWGAIGFGCSSLIGGALLQFTDWPSIFFLYCGLQLGAAAVISTMDMQEMTSAGGGGGDSVLVEMDDELGSVAVEPSLQPADKHRSACTIIFFLLITLGGALSGVIDTFLFVRLTNLGADQICLGAARFVMCAAEVPFFKVSGAIIDKLGVYGTLALTGAAYSVRFGYYAWLTEPWAVLPAEILHGITFAALWSVAVVHAQWLAPPGKAALYQGVVEALHWGLGYGAGSAVGGLAFEYRGAVWTFVAAALVAVGMTVWSAIVEVQQRAVASGPFSAVEASTPRSVAEVEADWEACWEDNELEEVPMAEDEKDGLSTSTHRTSMNVSSCMDD